MYSFDLKWPSVCHLFPLIKRNTILLSCAMQLGDLYAHFGTWEKAGSAWQDALDTLLGPYEVSSSGAFSIYIMMTANALTLKQRQHHVVIHIQPFW